MTGLVKRSVRLAGHRTSVALEPAFWAVLKRMAQHRGESLAVLMARIDAERPARQPLASALRLTALTAVTTAQKGDAG